MGTYFFTLGQSHTHRVNGKTWDKDSVLQVNAINEVAATEKVFSLFGEKWANCYVGDDIDMGYFSNGIIAVIKA